MEDTGQNRAVGCTQEEGRKERGQWAQGAAASAGLQAGDGSSELPAELRQVQGISGTYLRLGVALSPPPPPQPHPCLCQGLQKSSRNRACFLKLSLAASSHQGGKRSRHHCSPGRSFKSSVLPRSGAARLITRDFPSSET